jgi:SAM-dependent methyltransferase
MAGAPPIPPPELRERVGKTPEGEDLESFYVELGRLHKERIDQIIPGPKRRVLDFGCGAGRTLRHFLPEAEQGVEVWGCDIDADSVRWVEESLCPPLHVFQVSETPGMAQPDGYFDAIWGISVFTHITDQWAGWLLELHRVLADDGYLLLTILNEGHTDWWRTYSGTRWNPDRVGMATFGEDADWEHGGPMVFLSEWWVRAHWGRAFSVEQFAPRGFGPGDQGHVLLRKRPGTYTVADLERPEPGERREQSAARWASFRRSPLGKVARRLRR